MPPLSFFQVNPDQTERLYQTAVDFAALAPGDVAVDAYAVRARCRCVWRVTHRA